MEHNLGNFKFKYDLNFNLSGEFQLSIFTEDKKGNNQILAMHSFAAGFFENFKNEQTIQNLLKDIKLIFSVFYETNKLKETKENSDEEAAQLKKLQTIQKHLNSDGNEFLIFMDNCLEFGEQFIENTSEDVKNIYLNNLINC